MNALQRIVLSSSFVWLCDGLRRRTQVPRCPAEPRSLGFDLKKVGWQHVPLSKLKRDTVYTVAQDGDRGAVLRASAEQSASLYVAMLKPAIAHRPTTLSWEWKTDALVAGADNRDKAREDAPLRVLVAFDGDQASLPKEEQTRFKRAKNLTGRSIPYAVLMYIWSDQVACGQRDRLGPHEPGQDAGRGFWAHGLGAWQSVQRNLADDYKLAFGAAPGPVLGVAVMTDTDNTGASAVGEYAGIRLSCAKP